MVILIGWLLGGQVLPGDDPRPARGPRTGRWPFRARSLSSLRCWAMSWRTRWWLAATACRSPPSPGGRWAGSPSSAASRLTAGADLRIAAAGPATSLAAGLIFGGLATAVHAGGGPGLAVAALGWLAVDERPARGVQPAFRCPAGRRADLACGPVAALPETGCAPRSRLGGGGGGGEKKGGGGGDGCRRVVSGRDRQVCDERGRRRGHGRSPRPLPWPGCVSATP